MGAVLAAFTKACSSYPAPRKPALMAHASHLRIWQAEAGGQEFEVILIYI